jgi:hypothetical protein
MLPASGFALAVPFTQLTQIDEACGDHSPKPHDKHSPEEVAAFAGWCVPASHFLQVSEPRSSWYSPDWHSTHESSPAVGFVKPLAHLVHAAMEVDPLLLFS